MRRAGRHTAARAAGGAAVAVEDAMLGGAVVVVGLQAQVIELEAERGSSETTAVEAAETNGGGEPNLDSLPMVDRKMPCLDLLLSENILSHILATSRMPVSLNDAEILIFLLACEWGEASFSRRRLRNSFNRLLTQDRKLSGQKCYTRMHLPLVGVDDPLREQWECLQGLYWGSSSPSSGSPSSSFTLMSSPPCFFRLWKRKRGSNNHRLGIGRWR